MNIVNGFLFSNAKMILLRVTFDIYQIIDIKVRHLGSIKRQGRAVEASH